ncbi:MAG TPA: hypothetical protein VL625_06945 [Patescibacteria group bacterium]|nr:hypothetical protein [Patescibacteria group bacterium]
MKHTMKQVYILVGALFAVLVLLLIFAGSPNHNVKVGAAPDIGAVVPKTGFSKDKEAPW